MNELRAKLVDLEETRETAEPELTALRNRAGRIERLERKAEAILEHHARITAGR